MTDIMKAASSVLRPLADNLNAKEAEKNLERPQGSHTVLPWQYAPKTNEEGVYD